MGPTNQQYKSMIDGIIEWTRAEPVKGLVTRQRGRESKLIYVAICSRGKL